MPIDLNALKTFVDKLMIDIGESHAYLLEPEYGEQKSLGPDGRLVPEILEIRAAIRRKAVEAGFFGGFMPTEVGGQSWTNTEQIAVYELLANTPAYPQVIWPDLSLHAIGQVWGPTKILLNGDADVRAKFLAPLMSGEVTTCTAITDPLAGSDPFNMFAKATRRDGGWAISGTKQFVGNAPYADFALFYARTSGERGDYNGLSLFAVESDRPGYAIDRVFPVMEGRGNHGQITLDDCFVPAGSLIGEEGRGFTYMMQVLNSYRLMMGAQSLGAARWCLDVAVNRAAERRTFDAPLSERQGIQFMLADVATEIELHAALLSQAAQKLDAGEPAREITSMVKLNGPKVYGHAADVGMQVFGGSGFLADNYLERHYRRARGMRLWVGTDEMQRRTIAHNLFSTAGRTR